MATGKESLFQRAKTWQLARMTSQISDRDGILDRQQSINEVGLLRKQSNLNNHLKEAVFHWKRTRFQNISGRIFWTPPTVTGCIYLVLLVVSLSHRGFPECHLPNVMLALPMLVCAVLVVVLWRRWWWQQGADPSWMWLPLLYTEVVCCYLNTTFPLCDEQAEFDGRILDNDPSASAIWYECEAGAVPTAGCSMVDLRSRAECYWNYAQFMSVSILLAGYVLWQPTRMVAYIAVVGQLVIMVLMAVVAPIIRDEDFLKYEHRRAENRVVVSLFVYAALLGAIAWGAHIRSLALRERMEKAGQLELQQQKRRNAPKGRVAMLETDLEGSTALWEGLEADTMRSAVSIMYSTARQILPEHFGWESHTEGDSLVVAFHEVFDAVAFALHFQQRLLTAHWPYELLEHPNAKRVENEDGNVIFQGLRVRCGIHVGMCHSAAFSTWGAPTSYSGRTCSRTEAVSASGPGGMVTLSEKAAASIVGNLVELDQVCHRLRELDTGNLIRFRNLVGVKHEEAAGAMLVSSGWHTLGVKGVGKKKLAHWQTELFSILPTTLTDRHEYWAQNPPEMKSEQRHAPGFYDSPGRDGSDIAIMFLQICDVAVLRRWDKEITDQQIELAEGYLRRLIGSEGGYAIPRRDGRLIAVFNKVQDALHVFALALEEMPSLHWDDGLLQHDKCSQVLDMNGTVFFCGLRLQAGLCVGPLERRLEHTGIADFQGPAANRAARLCAKSNPGVLLALEEQSQDWDHHVAALSLGRFRGRPMDLKGVGRVAVNFVERVDHEGEKLMPQGKLYSVAENLELTQATVSNLPPLPSKTKFGSYDRGKLGSYRPSRIPTRAGSSRPHTGRSTGSGSKAGSTPTKGEGVSRTSTRSSASLPGGLNRFSDGEDSSDEDGMDLSTSPTLMSSASTRSSGDPLGDSLVSGYSKQSFGANGLFQRQFSGEKAQQKLTSPREQETQTPREEPREEPANGASEAAGAADGGAAEEARVVAAGAAEEAGAAAAGVAEEAEAAAAEVLAAADTGEAPAEKKEVGRSETQKSGDSFLAHMMEGMDSDRSHASQPTPAPPGVAEEVDLGV